jgi:hypothetical protein
MLDYQHPPPAWIAPAPSAMIELRLPLAKVAAICRLLGATGAPELYACSMWARGGCLVILPIPDDRVSDADQRGLREHEIAHCNGWPADHPGGRR